MPPANIIPHPAIRPRSLANVLSDLKEARDDLASADGELSNATLGMHSRHYDELQDRYTEAETRLEDLREEFEARFLETNGMSIADLWKAREEAVL